MNMKEYYDINMKEYYDRRKAIQDLYIHEIEYGDIAGTLLGIREQMSSIESMSLEIQNFVIKIELVHGTADDTNKVCDRVANAINNYILANVDRVTNKDTAEKIRSDIASGKKYYDIVQVGHMIEFDL